MIDAAFVRRWAPFAGGLTLTACAGLVGLYGVDRDAIRAPHARHAQADVDCATCHETIFEATTLQQSSLPKEKVCLGCHKQEKADCAFCHTHPDKPQTFSSRSRDLVIDHAAHLERVKEDCSVCHKALPEPFRTESMAPPMAACLSCHEHQAQYDAGNCQVCHTALSKYKYRPVGDFSHRDDWTRNHRLEARAAGASCATCHQQSFCAECHARTVAAKVEFIFPERVDRNFIHRQDFVSRHMVEARADEATCQRCHGVDTCQACHARNRLAAGRDGTIDPHPNGFGDGALHGPAARRDIVSCAACHDQGAASNCVGCHKVGGVAGTPHPASWTGRHGIEEVGRNAMCLICHL